MQLDVLHAKRILLISPQPWDHLHISKHHYATELARENEVVFLQPPEAAGPRLNLRPHTALRRLRIASWRPFTPKAFRFHAYPLYRFGMRWNAAWLAAQLGGIDVLWCFDFNVFPDLDAFGAGLRIFHPVDPLSSPRQAAIADRADLVISVSERILSNFASGAAKNRMLLVNHGLSNAFADLARQPAGQRCPGRTRCGYFGNLDRPIVHLALLAATIRANPKVEFHFWGPFRSDGRFASEIATLPNVRAHGAVETSELALKTKNMDMFVLAYLHHPSESDRSNAHKLLEYMSTGKVIVATRMDCYSEDPDLVRMSRQLDDSDFPTVFSAALAEVQSLNAADLSAKRKDFCLQFTYAANIRKIDVALAALPKRPVKAKV